MVLDSVKSTYFLSYPSQSLCISPHLPDSMYAIYSRCLERSSTFPFIFMMNIFLTFQDLTQI